MRSVLTWSGRSKIAAALLVIAVAAAAAAIYSVATSPPSPSASPSPTPTPLPLPTGKLAPSYSLDVKPTTTPSLIPTEKPTPTSPQTSIPTSSFIPTPTITPGPTEPTTPEKVLDSAMYYLKSNHPDTAQFMKDLVWTGGRVTPIVVGEETYMYYSQGWNVTISYPVAPDPTYSIVADYSAVGTGIPYRIIWKGTWHSEVLNETSYVFAQ